jgi:ketosteroid isomerase-like protein
VLGLNARGIYRLPTRQVGPAGLIGDYFAAVTAHDADLLRTLFAPDATFDVDGDLRRGHEQILAYYTQRTFTFDDFRPEAQPIQVDGSKVTVDIDVHIGGADNRVRDVFELRDGRITSLVVRGFADALRAAGPVGSPSE